MDIETSFSYVLAWPCVALCLGTRGDPQRRALHDQQQPLEKAFSRQVSAAAPLLEDFSLTPRTCLVLIFILLMSKGT